MLSVQRRRVFVRKRRLLCLNCGASIVDRLLDKTGKLEGGVWSRTLTYTDVSVASAGDGNTVPASAFTKRYDLPQVDNNGVRPPVHCPRGSRLNPCSLVSSCDAPLLSNVGPHLP